MVENSEAKCIIAFNDGVQSNLSSDENGEARIELPSWYTGSEDQELSQKLLNDYNNVK